MCLLMVDAQYTVFVFEEEPTNWLDENDFISIKDYENEGYFFGILWVFNTGNRRYSK